ncbi:MAG: sialate O-acetylesterase [Victivallales bacterium]|jgi:hypothetical protein
MSHDINIKWLCSIVTGLFITGVACAAESKLSEETRKWVQSVAALDGGIWSECDVEAINAIVEEVNRSSSLAAAKKEGKLLVAPFRGPNAASRRRCLFHPKGPTISLEGTLSDPAYMENGLNGDGSGFADTLFDGAGLGTDSLMILIHGRYFETLPNDPNCYLISGRGTQLNGETGSMHKNYSPKFIMGSTFNFSLGGTVDGRAFPSGTIGFISQKTAERQYRYYFNNMLVEGASYPAKRGISGKGNATFKLLSDGRQGSKANIQTLIIGPALSHEAYLSLQKAIAVANAERTTYRDVMKVTTPKRIWIFAGQSNCAGDQVNVKNIYNRSQYPDDDWHPNILQWARSGDNAGKAVPASNPMDFDGGGAPVGVGPAMAFAKTILEHDPRQQILVIPAAVGATGFSSNDWNPGDKVYEKMLSMVNEALQDGGTIDGIVWNQGEGDTKLNAVAYAAAWEKMFKDLSSRIKDGWPNQALIIYGDLAKGTFSNVTGAIEKHLVPANERRVFVTKEMAGINQLSMEEAFDDASKIHYSAKSQRLLGKAYAKAALSLKLKK